MSERLKTIVDGLALKPHHRVLEIGCGHGVAASFICARLGPSGRYVGLDRSDKMVAAAERKNAAYCEKRQARFVCEFFENFEPGSERFDVILAIRVRAFRTNADAARQRVVPWLTRGGRLVVIYDEPRAQAGRVR
jgi:cyclopropane fatty-acyl-phospholipid synthase-like methyltransferase